MDAASERPAGSGGFDASTAADPLTIWEAQREELARLSPEELAAFATAAADQAKASQAELSDEADARRARRYQAN